MWRERDNPHPSLLNPLNRITTRVPESRIFVPKCHLNAATPEGLQMTPLRGAAPSPDCRIMNP